MTTDPTESTDMTTEPTESTDMTTEHSSFNTIIGDIHKLFDIFQKKYEYIFDKKIPHHVDTLKAENKRLQAQISDNVDLIKSLREQIHSILTESKYRADENKRLSTLVKLSEAENQRLIKANAKRKRKIVKLLNAPTVHSLLDDDNSNDDSDSDYEPALPLKRSRAKQPSE